MNQIRRYLVQDCNADEKNEYVQYIYGDNTKVSWIVKALKRRNTILNANLVCHMSECGSYIDIRETGMTKCGLGHDNSNTILVFIESLSNLQ